MFKQTISWPSTQKLTTVQEYCRLFISLCVRSKKCSKEAEEPHSLSSLFTVLNWPHHYRKHLFCLFHFFVIRSDFRLRNCTSYWLHLRIFFFTSFQLPLWALSCSLSWCSRGLVLLSPVFFHPTAHNHWHDWMSLHFHCSSVLLVFC